MNAPFRVNDTPERVRLSVDDFLLLSDRGAFDDYAKTELIDGDIYGVNAQCSRHARVKTRLARIIGNWLEQAGSDLEVLIEPTVRVSQTSAPEPDVVLTRFQGEREIPADTIALVIEIADSTLATDLGRKAELYAGAGIAEYWVVDVHGDRVVVHHAPGADGYAQRAEQPLGEALASVTIDGLVVATASLLG